MKKTLLYLSTIGLSIIFFSHTWSIQNGEIDLDNLFNYANQSVPDYIDRDNTPNNNPITDEGATLGRVLFYDVNLSINNTISCASCHMQEFAFSDTARLSVGHDGGVTGRHAMRLINARFGQEVRFFWDERAASVESQSTQPIKDHIEMGFSNEDGLPSMDSLINKLSAIDYYQELFTRVYGDATITEARMQLALAQFIRSIQSFDSKYDEGRAMVEDDFDPFPNFTPKENTGKRIFLTPPNLQQPGAGCAVCHRPPEFDIDPHSFNNNVISSALNSEEIDLTNTRSPSLRDLVNPDGVLNGPLMHNGDFNSIAEVIEHYNFIEIDPQNTNLDPRLGGPTTPNTPPPPIGQDLNLTQGQKEALEAFLLTLTGSNVYTDERWSNPFDENGNLDVYSSSTSIQDMFSNADFSMYPNPSHTTIHIECACEGRHHYSIYSIDGKEQIRGTLDFVAETAQVDLSPLHTGTYFIYIQTANGKPVFTSKLVKK